MAEVTPIASAAAKSAAAVIPPINRWTRDRMFPSLSATRRMARASVPGRTSSIWRAIEPMYGVQYQRS